MKKQFVFTAVLLCLFFAELNAQNWSMKPVVLKSHWSKQVNPANTLKAYPRPALVRNQWRSLNGLWEYAITDSSTALRTVSTMKYQGKILVPYPIESALSGVQKPLLPNQILWYKKEINKPVFKSGERVLLHFGAVDWQATIYVNGKEIGMHTGGYTAFSFDITERLKVGKNEIIVKVFDPTEQGINPHGKQTLQPGNIYYTASSGIWQTVWLEIVPASFVDDLIIIPDVDASVVKITVKSSSNSIVQIQGAGQIVKGKTNTVIVIPVKNAKLWSPEHPYLYDVTVKLGTDVVKSYFGMRKISIDKDEKGIDRIFLNNKPYFNLGVLDQGFWPEGLYTAPTDEALVFDIKTIKQMGFNTIRKHIKVEPAQWYYHADKIGLLVWQDFVNPNQRLPEGAKQQFETETKEILLQLKHYPSIITWVLFNERWGAYDQQRLTEWVKATDPTRLVNGHSGELLYVNNELRAPSGNPYVGSDMSDVHSYPDPRMPLQQNGKAMVIGEFGGVGVSVPYHQWNDLQGWGYVQMKPIELVEKYSGMISILKEMKEKGLSGSIYTQPFDVEGEENGLLTYDRAMVKIPLDVIRRFNQSIYSEMPASTSMEPIAKNIDVNDSDDRYPEFLALYENGKRDSSFLRRLTLMALRKKDKGNASKIQATYISVLKNVYTRDNLNFLVEILNSSTDAAFDIFYKNAEKVNSVLGSNTAQRIARRIIIAEEITSHTVGENAKPDWLAIENNVLIKYGENELESVYGYRMVYENRQQNWKEFGRYFKLYFDRAIGRSRFHVNNMCWPVFEHINDTAVLNTAIRAMQYDIEHYTGNDHHAIDTYANLLYKVGRKEEAIVWMKKAVNLSGNDKSYETTLEKMQRGEKTWIEN